MDIREFCSGTTPSSSGKTTSLADVPGLAGDGIHLRLDAVFRGSDRLLAVLLLSSRESRLVRLSRMAIHDLRYRAAHLWRGRGNGRYLNFSDCRTRRAVSRASATIHDVFSDHSGPLANRKRFGFLDVVAWLALASATNSESQIPHCGLMLLLLLPLDLLSRNSGPGRGSQVARRRSAKPLSAVRFCPAPPKFFHALETIAVKNLSSLALSFALQDRCKIGFWPSLPRPNLARFVDFPRGS